MGRIKLSGQFQQLDIKSLTGLLYLLEERNVGRAADRLFISQSAMSRLLTRLREGFDDPLFVRTARGMIPTSKALALELPVRQMLEQLASLIAEPQFVPHLSDRTFRLQTTHYQAQAYGPSIAERFYQQAPNASLDTSTVSESSLLEDPGQPCDVILCSNFIHVPPHFERQLLGREKYVLIMAQDHPLAMQERVSIAEYLSYSHVLVSLGGGAKLLANDPLGKLAQEKKFALRTPYFMAALEAVGRTQLLFSSSGLLASQYAERFGLTIKPLPFESNDIDYYLVWPKAVDQDPGSLWLRNLCSQVVRELIPFPVS
ncbi:LysR family transcriptional regulator [Amphritea pacifica]|uniref:LysR family transcriptional regulator n=1 Tax=Amphritea pacifica TaxID=2811233 RepID=A0ABS2W2M1_9GAMM|nr:LysR family transcriptional regulator [Amphritea pacifica]MBN0985954.1 LysR family transcriptional regulator [Amphritea pacifica]